MPPTPDPKREAAVAALEAVDLSVVLHPVAGETRYWSLFLDAMLANPQPFLAVLLRVALPQRTRLVLAAEDFTAAFSGLGVTGEWNDPLPEGWYVPTFTRHYDAALTETAAEPALATDDEGHIRDSRMLEAEPARSKEPTNAE